MPNNLKSRGLTDREILQLCLELEKGRCRSLSSTNLEIYHSELRKVYEHCYNRAHHNHQKIFDQLTERDWYRITEATQVDIENVQEIIKHNLNPSS